MHRKLNIDKIYNSLIKIFVLFKLSIHNLNVDITSQKAQSSDLIMGKINNELDTIIFIRVQLSYMLFNSQLYDLNDYKILISLFDTFSKILPKHPQTEMFTNYMLKRILTFTPILSIKHEEITNIIDKNYNADFFNQSIPINVVQKSYTDLLVTFLWEDKSSKLIDEFCCYLNTTDLSEDIFNEFITMLFLNIKLLDKIKDLKKLNEALIYRSKECQNNTFIMIVLLYLEINNKNNKIEDLKSIDQFLFQSSVPKNFLIKAILISLYGFQITNEEKIQYTFKIVGFPVQKVRKQNEINLTVCVAFLKNCRLLLTDGTYDEITEGYKILEVFIRNILYLDVYNSLFIEFFKEENHDDLYLLFKTVTQLKNQQCNLFSEIIPPLIKSHKSPFIFKFFLCLSQHDHYEEFLIDSMKLIVHQLEDLSKSNKSYFIYNLANLLIYFYAEANNYNKSLFRFVKMEEVFSKVIDLLERSNLLLVKVLFPVNKNENKLMSEIVFELFLFLIYELRNENEYEIVSNCIFKDSPGELLILFRNIFRMKDENIQESVFYLLDNNDNKTIPTNEDKEIRKIESEYYKDYTIFNESSINLLLTIVLNKYRSLGKEVDKLCELVNWGDFIYKCTKGSNDKSPCRINRSKDQKNNKTSNILQICLDQNPKDFEKLNVVYEDYSLKQKEKLFKSGDKKNASQSSNNVSFSSQAKTTPNLLTINKTFSNRNRSQFSDENDSYVFIVKEKNKEEFIHFQHVGFDGLIVNPKKYFFTKHFAQYFKDVYFFNQNFIDMKNYYIQNFTCNPYTKEMNYPSKRKNYSNKFYPHIFLKQDMNFFRNQEFFSISHQYYTSHVTSMIESRIDFKRHSIEENMGESLHNFYCEMIKINQVLFGLIKIYDDYIIFQTNVDIKQREAYNKFELDYVFSSLLNDRKIVDKECVIYFKEIKMILIRRYLLMWQGIEIFLKNGRSYFFNLFQVSNLKLFFQLMKAKKMNKIKLVDNCQEYFQKKDYSEKWSKKKISTYEYLLLINKYSSRTFNDNSQYYIFPWLICSYENYKELKFPLNPAIIRNFERLISLQSDEKLKKMKNKIKDIDPKDLYKKYSGHYSTSAFVFYYLMRLNPYTQEMIKLQNMAQENPNRMFNSIEEILHLLKETDDNREILPEFSSSIEFMLNLNCNDFGKRSKIYQIDDLKFDEGQKLSEYVYFIVTQNNLLMDSNVNMYINSWIDNIFGKKQIIELKKNKDPSFIVNKSSYEQLIKFEEKKKKYIKSKIPTEDIRSKLCFKINSTINFGQTPYQLFTSSHPHYLIEEKGKPNTEDSFEYTASKLFHRHFLIETKYVPLYYTKINDYLVVLTNLKNFEIYDLQKKKCTNDLKNWPFKIHYKLNITPAKIKEPLFKPKYAFCILNTDSNPEEWLFIIGRYLDHSIKMFRIKCEKTPYEVLTEDFVCSIVAINQTKFLAGLRNGKLIEYEVVNETKEKNPNEVIYKIYQKKYVIAHESEINVIAVDKKNGIITTSGTDHYIYIRKLYDFELLTVIKEHSSLITRDILIPSLNFIYTMSYNVLTKSSKINGYTMTGMLFASSDFKNYSCFCFTESLKLLVQCLGDNYITIMSPSTLTEEDKHLEEDLNMEIALFEYKDEITFLSFSKKKDVTIITNK